MAPYSDEWQLQMVPLIREYRRNAREAARRHAVLLPIRIERHDQNEWLKSSSSSFWSVVTTRCTSAARRRSLICASTLTKWYQNHQCSVIASIDLLWEKSNTKIAHSRTMPRNTPAVARGRLKTPGSAIICLYSEKATQPLSSTCFGLTRHNLYGPEY